VTGFLRRWGPALLWTALLFAVSSRPSLPVDLHSGTDKLAHFAAYSVLGVLLAFGQVRSGMFWLWPILMGITIGGLEELYQGTVPNRHSDVGDWIADSLGVINGVVLYNLWCRARLPGSTRVPPSDPLPHE
jgi:VanZ family protein